MNVLVLGAKGNLGQELVRAFERRGHRVVGVDREDFDARDEAELERRVLDGRFDAIVNTVAFNDVDGAEDPARYPMAVELNAILPGMAARVAARAGAKLVHYSSDYVFDGVKPEGYREDDAPNPISRYGRTKLDGERAALSAGAAAYLVRSAKLFGEPGSSSISKPGFATMMLKLAAERPELEIVDEEVGSPTYARDLAEATCELLSGYPPGTYHLVNEGPGVTWYGFAEELFGLLGSTVRRKPVPSSAFPKPARRPKFAPLLNTRGPKLRPRIEALRIYLGR